MATQRKVEVFTAGCPVCDETVELVREMACPSCEVIVSDTRDEAVARRAKELGIKAVPAVAVDGVPASCCEGRGVTAAALKDAGVGVPV